MVISDMHVAHKLNGTFLYGNLLVVECNADINSVTFRKTCLGDDVRR